MAKALLHELGKSISYGRLPLLSKVLWPMLLAASDDQGRGSAEADVIKWHVCPNVAELTQETIAAALNDMAAQEMIHVYVDDRDRPLLQIARWWEYQQLTWAQPSRYPAPDGWTDRVRYQRAGGDHKENWAHPGGWSELPPSPDIPPDPEPPAPDTPPSSDLPSPDLDATSALSGAPNQIKPTQTNPIQHQTKEGASRAPPDTPPTDLHPANLTVQDVKRLDLHDGQWRALQRDESKGKNRKSVIAHCERMLNRPPPAILAFQEAIGRYPKKLLWKGIHAVVGEEPANVEFWRQVCANWLATDWNPQNVKGMLEHYQERKLPSTKPVNRGARQRPEYSPADYAIGDELQSPDATPVDVPTRVPPSAAEQIWSEVVGMWRGSYPQLAEIRAMPGDAAEMIMLSGNRSVIEPVKARMGEQLADWVDDVAGRHVDIAFTTEPA